MMFLAWIYVFGLLFGKSSAYQTKNVDITTTIQNHFAETTISSDIVNEANVSTEIDFQVMLPKEAFITHFEMVIDGDTFEGEIKEKDQAKKLYTEAKRRGKTTGLVEARDETDKIFKTSVNVGAGTLVHFKLVYQQLLRKRRGIFSNKIILFGDQLSDTLSMDVFICESRALKNVTVPPILIAGGAMIQPMVAIDVDGNFAHVEFLNNGQNDLAESLGSGGAAFIVDYELESSPGTAGVVVDDGYFLYFGPDIDLLPRRIVFVLDVSGSMDGLKLQQLKQAMHNILSKLTISDRFDVMKFSGTYRNWMGSLTPATSMNIQSAKKFIDGWDQLGGTNIWDALKHALVVMHNDTAEGEPLSSGDYILLLTDGEGTLSQTFVLGAIKTYNRRKFAIHTISFGTDANNGFLKRIAARNKGKWKQILVDLDSSLQIENFVDELGLSTQLPLVIKYPEAVKESLPVGSKYGGEIVSVGKFQEKIDPRNRGSHAISISGFSNTNESVIARFDLEENTAQCGGMGGRKIKNFAKKAFGMVKVQKTLWEMDLTSDPTEKSIFKQQAVNLSLEYNLVTPVTSMIVIKPEDEVDISSDLEKKSSDLPISPTHSPWTTTTTRPVLSGASGPRWSLHSDPHFLARLSDDVTICFNWIGRNGEVVNLFSDSISSVFINALIEGDSNQVLSKGGFTKRLFVTKVAILLPGKAISIMIDPEGLTVSGSAEMDGQTLAFMPLRNVFYHTLKTEDMEFTIVEANPEHVILDIKLYKDTSIVVEIHHWSPHNNRSRDHLDLAMPTYNGDSVTSGGLLGHLQTNGIMAGTPPTIISRGMKNETFLEFNHAKIPVQKRKMKVPYLKAEVECWFAKGHFQHLLGSRLQHFKLRNLMEFPGML